MTKNTKLLGTLSLLEVLIVIAFGLVSKASENIYSNSLSYRRISLALIAIIISFLAVLSTIIWLSLQEAKAHPRKKYYPVIAAFAISILASVIWMVIYTQPTCGCGA